MDGITLIRVLTGIAFLTLLIVLILMAIKKHRKVGTGEKEAVPGLSSSDRIYIYLGCFFSLLMALIAQGSWGFGFALGHGFGNAGISFVIAYVAYGRKERWHTFARLFFWLCVILAMLPFYPAFSGK